MPLFDYVCQSCSHEFEALQGINDDALSTCPDCGKEKLQKKVSAPAFTFKGGGWYKDLYSSAKSGSASESAKTSSDPSASSTADNKSTESKPATKAAS